MEIGANAAQHLLSDLQEGVWYTITMFAKSQSTVAGPVIVTLSKFTNYINITISLAVLILCILFVSDFLPSHGKGEGCQCHSTLGVLGCFKERTPLHHLL